MKRNILFVIFIIFNFIADINSNDLKKGYIIFKEAKGYPENIDFGKYDYLLIKENGLTFVIINKNTDQIKKDWKIINLKTDRSYLVTSVNYFIQNNEMYLLYYMSNFDYGSSRFIKYNLKNNRIEWVNKNSCLNPGIPVYYNNNFYLSGYGSVYKVNELNGKTEWQVNNFSKPADVLDIFQPAEICNDFIIYKDRSNLSMYVKINDLDGKIIEIVTDEKMYGKDYYKPKVEALRLRESPSLAGRFVRSLAKSEKLELLEKGKEETINSIKGNWVKVKTTKGEIGWCFSGYLEKIK